MLQRRHHLLLVRHIRDCAGSAAVQRGNSGGRRWAGGRAAAGEAPGAGRAGIAHTHYFSVHGCAMAAAWCQTLSSGDWRLKFERAGRWLLARGVDGTWQVIARCRVAWKACESSCCPTADWAPMQKAQLGVQEP